jgi:transketolase
MTTRRELANAIRALAMDAVQRANSGHPGMPMGMADIAQVLWSDFMRYNPANPLWVDRDRFVLSNGHGSMLLYSVLHLTGYPFTIEDLKRVPPARQQDPGSPGARPRAWHRDHDRPARAGSGQRRRHGTRREAAGGRVQSRRPQHC